MGHLPKTQTQLYSDLNTTNNNLSQKFAAKDISNKSLDQITTTGFYFGSNITEVTPYIASHKWCLINAFVSEKSASIFVMAGDAMALSIYRNGDGRYSHYPIATKSDLTDIIVEKGFQKSVNIPAGNAYATIECDIEYTIPSGYSALTICKGLVTNSTCCVYNTYFTNGKARLVISNLNGSQKTVTAYAFILFIKS